MNLLLDEKGLNIKISNSSDLIIGSEEIRLIKDTQTIIFRNVYGTPSMSLDNGETYSVMLFNTWEDVQKLVGKYVHSSMSI